MARESMETPVTGTARSPLTSAPCVARTMSCTVKGGGRRLRMRALRQRLARDVPVVEGQDLGPDDLVRLVTLSRNHHLITALTPHERGPDGGATIRLGDVAAGAARIPH